MYVRNPQVGKDGKPTSGAQRYKITVYTSDVKWAGTDANVSIELRGDKSNSGLRKLASSKNDFERGAIDEFFVEAPDLGALLAVDIGHDNRGGGAGWHLNKVCVLYGAEVASSPSSRDAGTV